MRLLIAHKSSTARAALIDAVPRDGHAPPEIVVAEDGHEALYVLLGDDAPGLAFVDWDLPGIEGPELCRLVRDFHLSIPPSIVVLAGSRHTDTRDAYGAGAAHCVSTPASLATIRASMEAGLRAARERRASDERDDRSSVRASLEAVRTYENDSASFFDFAAAGAGFDPQTRRAVEPPGPAAEPHRRAVLEAVLHPS
jgi:DNA-binding response OmpR family regulator